MRSRECDRGQVSRARCRPRPAPASRGIPPTRAPATAIFLPNPARFKSSAPFPPFPVSPAPPIHSLANHHPPRIPEFLTPQRLLCYAVPPFNGDDARAAIAERRRCGAGAGAGLGAARGEGVLGRAAPQVRRPGRGRQAAAPGAAAPQLQALVQARGVGALREGLRRGGRDGAGRATQAAPEPRRVQRVAGRAAAAHHDQARQLCRSERKRGPPRWRCSARRGRHRPPPRRDGTDVEEDCGGGVQDVRGEAPDQPRAAHQRHGLMELALSRPPSGLRRQAKLATCSPFSDRPIELSSAQGLILVYTKQIRFHSLGLARI